MASHTVSDLGSTSKSAEGNVSNVHSFPFILSIHAILLTTCFIALNL